MKKIGVTGAGGLVGRAVCREMAAAGWQVIGFSRSLQRNLPNTVAETRLFSLETPLHVDDLHAFVHLAGESILGRWTQTKKKHILESRVQGTRRVVDALGRSRTGIPLICASAVGYYGDTGAQAVDENSPQGKGFLSEVTAAWEQEALRAGDGGSRVVRLRFGMVLGAQGGAFPLLKRVFGLGLAGPLGSGRQWMSCLHVKDAARLVRYCVESGKMQGAYNAVQPAPVTNAHFTASLAQAMRRPACLPAPAFVLRAVLGEFSHLLLDSARVLPRRTGASGFVWQFPDLESVWSDLLASGGKGG